jgi:hypothetical protein
MSSIVKKLAPGGRYVEIACDAESYTDLFIPQEHSRALSRMSLTAPGTQKIKQAGTL